MNHRHQVVVVGGGCAGITVAAQLLNQRPHLDIAIVEPSEHHFYQPMWTLVGAGIFPREKSERPEKLQIPRGATWIKDFVDTFSPSDNTITTRGGKTIGYDQLVVAAGIQLNWDKVKGLKEAIGHDGVCSNYSYDTVGSTWESIRNLKSGAALFTHPDGAVKCGGAPTKIGYLAEDYFRRIGVRENIDVIFTLALPRIFAVDKYAVTLEEVIQRRGIDTRFRLELVELRPASKEAIYRHLDTGEESVIRYDMVHVTPPMGSPDFIAKSELAGDGGWVDVDKHTLQHVRFQNVFGIGDASSLPTSKTAAAIRKQAPVLVRNLMANIDGELLDGEYDGYTSCPVVTGYDSLVMAEFGYDKQPDETFPFDQSRERLSTFLLKKHGLPALYWHGMLRGRA